MNRLRISGYLLPLLLALSVFAWPLPARAKTPLVAVAANFIVPMEEIMSLYEAETGIAIQATFSSTGKLYAQIKAGAPYDLFLAADAKRPELLVADGLAAEPHVYATGRAVLWSGRRELASLKSWQAVIAAPRVRRLAISSPEVTPYGEAAVTALTRAGLWPQAKERLVYAHSVAQSFQFAGGGAEAAFTALCLALSAEGRKGIFWPIPEAPPVIQKGCVLKKAKAEAEARHFFSFLLHNDKARAIIKAYGYE